MKKSCLTTLILAIFFSAYSQSQIVTTGNNVVDTNNPIGADVVIGSNFNSGYRHDSSIMWWSNVSASRIACSYDVFYLSVWDTNNANIGLSAIYGNSSYLLGSVGVGTNNPLAKLHVLTNGTSSNATQAFNGDVIIQGNPGNRTSTTGATLEFVIPANTDGSNPWGQGRIITVAGNSNSGDATGKMILGTRRLFDKGTGTGNTWNYGDDIVINGSGNIGIGTLNPDQKLAVNGTIHAKQVLVDLSVPVPDYVFKKGYKLRPLSELKNYIDLNKHLPEVPSAKEMEKTGVDVNEINMKLLQKVEELTLYLIEKDKQLNKDEASIKKDDDLIKRLSRRIDTLENNIK